MIGLAARNVLPLGPSADERSALRAKVAALQVSLQGGPKLSKEGNWEGINGGPGEIRTPDLLIRSQSLYPAELRAH